MTGLSFDVALTKTGDDVWTTNALSLPNAHLASVYSARTAAIKHQVEGHNIRVGNAAATHLMGRLVLPDALVAASTLEEAKVQLEREKVQLEDRANKRTVWVSVATAIIAATATIGVALIASPGGKPTPPSTAPNAFRDLVECRQSLNRLTSLAPNGQQTLTTIREAITLHATVCDDRLAAAIAAASP